MHQPLPAGSSRSATRLLGSGLALLLLAVTLAVPVPALAAAPSIGTSGPVAYTEQDPPVTIGTDIAVTGGGQFDGQYVDFAVHGGGERETLSLADDGHPDPAAGVLSVVGSTAYLGDGTSASPIGAVDPQFDGQGKKLRVNFTSPFTNPGFEDDLGGTGITGWTALEQHIDLGVTTIAGHQTVDESTYPGDATNKDNNEPDATPTWDVGISTDGSPTEGQVALSLESSMNTHANCDVVHGPAAYSDTFEASKDDSIYFDWRAFASGDAYHVFGYIVDEAGTQTTVLDAYTTDTQGESAWDTKETIIPSTGTYRFVFVAGTYDASCGQAAGARLLIDNVRVYGTKVDDAVLTQLSTKLQYENTSDDPPSTRTVTVTATNADGEQGTGSVTIDITAIDDEPVFPGPDDVTFLNTAAEDSFSTINGTLSATDPDSSPIVFGLAGGGTDPWQTVDGTFSTLTVHSSGGYTLTPKVGAIEEQYTAGHDVYTVTATADGRTIKRHLAVDVAIDPSPPGAPTITDLDRGTSEVTVTWDPDAWIGGSATVDHELEYSRDGGTTWTPHADPIGTATTATVSDLQRGSSYTFRVRATNASGTSTWSEESAPIRLPRPSTPSDPEPEPEPEPLPDGDGQRAAPVPGDTGVTVDGEWHSEVETTTSANRSSITGDGFEIEVWNEDGDSEDTETGVGQVLRLPQGGNAGVRVAGFAPNSTVRVWLFSEPTLIGEFQTDGDGALEQGLAEVVADLTPCAHTLQAEGQLQDGREVAAALGVWVVADPFPFGDVSVDGHHAPAIGCLASLGAVYGMDADTFDEASGIHRAQAASIMARLLGLDLSGVPAFGDVAGGVHSGAIAAATETGLFQGVTEDVFDPQGVLTRGQAAAVLARATGLRSDEPSPFDDVRGSHDREIAALAEAGIVHGFGDGTFRPELAVRRGQFASMVARARPLLRDQEG